MIDFSADTASAVKWADRDILLQEIDLLFDTAPGVLFDTAPGEVLGQESFGTRYDRFLYNLSITNEGVRQQVLSDLSKIDLRGYEPEVDVLLMEGTEHDIAFIRISLTREGETFNRTYRLS